METIRINSKGPLVTKLTKRLIELGLYIGSPTNVFDTNVRQAVKVFQSHMFDSRGRPLEPDGVVGPLSWWALEAEDATDIFEDMDLDRFRTMPSCGGTEIGREALKVALEEMSKGSGEEGGNNQGPFVAKYHKISVERAKVKKWAWCAAFTSFCFAKGSERLNRLMPFKYTGGAQNILNQAKANKKYVFKPGCVIDEKAGTDIPQPGDVVVWKRGSQAWQGHVGIVHSIENGIMYVVEGNRGPYPSRVAVYDYVISRMENLLGVIRFE